MTDSCGAKVSHPSSERDNNPDAQPKQRAETGDPPLTRLEVVNCGLVSPTQPLTLDFGWTTTITGPSGGGKSAIFRLLKSMQGCAAIKVQDPSRKASCKLISSGTTVASFEYDPSDGGCTKLERNLKDKLYISEVCRMDEQITNVNNYTHLGNDCNDLKKFNSILKEVADIVVQQNNTRVWRICHSQGGTFELAQASSGQKDAIRCVMAIFLARKQGKGTVVLENPGDRLGQFGRERLCRRMESYCTNEKMQLIEFTSQPEMVNISAPNDLGIRMILFDSDDDNKFTHLHVVSCGSQIPKEVRSTTLRAAFSAPGCLIVEGPSDKLVLQELFSMIDADQGGIRESLNIHAWHGFRFHICNANCASNAESVFEALTDIKRDEKLWPTLLLLDAEVSVKKAFGTRGLAGGAPHFALAQKLNIENLKEEHKELFPKKYQTFSSVKELNVIPESMSKKDERVFYWSYNVSDIEGLLYNKTTWTDVAEEKLVLQTERDSLVRKKSGFYKEGEYEKAEQCEYALKRLERDNEMRIVMKNIKEGKKQPDLDKAKSIVEKVKKHAVKDIRINLENSVLGNKEIREEVKRLVTWLTEHAAVR